MLSGTRPVLTREDFAFLAERMGTASTLVQSTGAEPVAVPPPEAFASPAPVVVDVDPAAGLPGQL